MAARHTWTGWTTGELDRLEALRLEGQTSRQIALALGRTHSSVRCALVRQGLPRPLACVRWLPLLCVPHGLRALARRLGISPPSLTYAKKQLKALGYRVYACPRRNQYGVCGE